MNSDKFTYSSARGNTADTSRRSLKVLRKSHLWRQPITTSNWTVPSNPVGYTDQFHPHVVSSPNRNPSIGLLFEAQMTELITPGFLQIDDITVFSSIRKDSFCTISKAKKIVLLTAHKIMSPHIRLPFYKGNPTIIQNGFTVKVKNLRGACVLTFQRKTLYNPNEPDVLEIWFGNKVFPVGRVQKPALINEYLICGEMGQPLHVIYKARAKISNSETKKNFKYTIHNMEDEQVGLINCKGRRTLGPLVDGEYPCDINFNSELNIAQKSLLLGALFLIASRSHSGIERMEERTRTALDVEHASKNKRVGPRGIDQQNADDIFVRL